ncbi:hypothetical protein [Bacteroides sp.]
MEKFAQVAACGCLQAGFLSVSFLSGVCLRLVRWCTLEIALPL